MLEQLSCSVGFHQCNHLPLAREVHAMQQFKAFKAIVEAAAIEVIDEFAVAGELAVDVGEGPDHSVELHGNKQWVAGPYGCSTDCRSVLAHRCRCERQQRLLNTTSAGLVGHSTGLKRY